MAVIPDVPGQNPHQTSAVASDVPLYMPVMRQVEVKLADEQLHYWCYEGTYASLCTLNSYGKIEQPLP